MTLAFAFFIVVWGLLVGAVARWVVPGPNPMPVWVTTAIGIAGSILGGVVAKALLGFTGGFAFALAGSVLLVVLYRRFVQGRPPLR